MKIGEIYRLAIEKGMGRDPRTKTAVERLLEKENKQFAESACESVRKTLSFVKSKRELSDCR